MKKTIVFAAGCFWGVEELIREVPGVLNTEVGYCGGNLENPKYKDVSKGTTGHAEAIEVTYDSDKLSLSRLLDLFFNLHDPTTLNRQGNDVGSQYRSTIFYADEEERKSALHAIERAQSQWENPIKTSVEPLKKFYPAESEHQDYLQKNPRGYTCHYWRDGDFAV